MKRLELRQLIRESIKDYVREIEHSGNKAALEAKIAKIGEAIELREKKIRKDGIDEEMHDMIDVKKIKQYEKEVKELQKSLEKYKNQLDKMNGKSEEEVPSLEEETEDEGMVDEVALDENQGQEEYYSEMASQMREDGMTFDEIVTKLEDMGLDMRTAEKIADEYDADMPDMNPGLDEESEIEAIYERMQKLAGIYEAKKKPSAGLTKKQKSTVAKKAHAGKDIGKKGKGFEKVAKAAAKEYGSKEAGKKVAAAAMWKNIKRKK
jgi:deoxyribodipyrimidine photolyase